MDESRTIEATTLMAVRLTFVSGERTWEGYPPCPMSSVVVQFIDGSSAIFGFN